jgi:DNA-binding LacI/PurR family transcriptional regulator
MINGPVAWPCCRARLGGYRAALEMAGIEVDPGLVRDSTLYVEGGLRDATALLALPEPPTAVFTANDLQAHGVYEAARRAGARIPEDLSVVGFDDLPFSRWAVPPLTTVRQPLTEMGAAAAELVLVLARGEQPRHTRLELATEPCCARAPRRLGQGRSSLPGTGWSPGFPRRARSHTRPRCRSG